MDFLAIDLFILALAAIFGALGAASGASRQLAAAASIVIAFFLSRPIGRGVGPSLANWLGGPLLFGILAATLLCFIFAYILFRRLLSLGLQRVFGGYGGEKSGTDRTLGFGLGALKILAFAYVVISALVFAEENIRIAGQRLGISPQSSWAFALARRYNLFEQAQFRSAKDFLVVAKAAWDPNRMDKLKADPSFRALKEDARFQKALNDRQLKSAVDAGDVKALLKNNSVLQLISDPVTSARLAAAAAVAE